MKECSLAGVGRTREPTSARSLALFPPRASVLGSGFDSNFGFRVQGCVEFNSIQDYRVEIKEVIGFRCKVFSVEASGASIVHNGAGASHDGN